MLQDEINRKVTEEITTPQNVEPKSKRQRIRSGSLLFAVYFIVFSLAEFIVLELYFHKSFTAFPPEIIAKNVILIAMFNLLLVALCHELRVALAISSVLFFILGLVNYFVIAFRGYGIVFMDLFAIRTAATVAGNYHYTFDIYIVAGILGNLGLFAAALCFLPKRQKPYFYLKSMLLSLAAVVFASGFFFWMDNDTVFFDGVSGLTWDHNIGMQKYGYLLYFMSNAGDASIEEPGGYSVEKVDEILSKYEQEDSGADEKENTTTPTGKNPNLIMIMNEAYSDLQVLGDFDTNIDPMSFYHQLSENTIKGYAYSSVYGGYTANSEFEFLTGCTKAYLPGNPYLQYMEGTLPSLISNLKAQGYDHPIALHPYNPSGYNRNRVYPLLGFEKFYSIEDFDVKNPVRDYVGDMENYQKIEELYEKRDKSVPFCLFNVTMQNHNPYDDDTYTFEEPVKIESFPSVVSTNQYLSLMHMSDQALKQLISYFQKVDEPTMIVLFGDHQPHLADSFYEKVMGVMPDQFSKEQVMKKYKIPFLIWANYDIPEQTIDMISLNYLSKRMLKTAGLAMSDFDRFVMHVEEQIPSLSATGYYDNEGVLHNFSEEEEENNALLEEYEIVQYHYLFDEKNRLKGHFQVP